MRATMVRRRSDGVRELVRAGWLRRFALALAVATVLLPAAAMVLLATVAVLPLLAFALPPALALGAAFALATALRHRRADGASGRGAVLTLHPRA